MNTTSDDSTDGGRASWMRRILLWIVPILVVGTTVYLYGAAGRYATTDNAYVQQDRVDVAAQVSGNVREVNVDENAHVAAGQPIVRLDDAQLKVAAAAAEAHLVAARAEVAGLEAAYKEKTGEIAVARRAAEFADRDVHRQRELAEHKLVSVSALDTSERSQELAHGAVNVLDLQLRQTATRLGNHPDLPVDRHPLVQAALAEVEHARLDLEHTVITAPQAGIASHLPKVGNRVEVARAVFAIVTDRPAWVEANFKETDLEWVRPGQAVTIDVDTYPHRHWTGHVDSIAQGTGAEFSLLPAQNASGNWVKVVQRIAVRITIDHSTDEPPLRAGMSATVSVDTGAHTRFDRWLGRGR